MSIISFIFRFFSKSFLRYLLGGIGATLLNFTLYSLLCHLHCHYLLSNLFATFATWTFSFIVNKFFVFQVQNGNVKRESTEFFSLQIILFLLSFVLLYISVDICRINKNIAWILTGGINFLINYMVTSLVIWKKK